MIDANNGTILDWGTLKSLLDGIKFTMSQDQLNSFTINVNAQALLDWEAQKDIYWMNREQSLRNDLMSRLQKVD